MLKGTIPGRIREPTEGNRYSVQPIRQNSIVISIKPIADIYLDGPPEHDERCSIVWTNGRRIVKYISRACPYHCKTKCLVEAAN